jgi:tetratricopeptide (TPR) repeat protein
MDFGVAKHTLSDNNSLASTKTGALIGSPMYMSPEQCRGEKVDARADLYALGCVMFEALSGQAPFQGESALEVMYKHLSEPPPPVPGVSGRVQALIHKAMAKGSGERFTSAEEMRQELLACRGLSLAEATVGRLALKQRPHARLRKDKLLGAAIVSLVVLAAAAFCLINNQQNPVQTSATEEANIGHPLEAVRVGNKLYQEGEAESRNAARREDLYKRALRCFERGLLLSDQLNRDDQRADLYIGEANVYSSLMQIDRAGECYRQALKAAREYGGNVRTTEVTMRYAAFLRNNGRDGEALTYERQALSEYKRRHQNVNAMLGCYKEMAVSLEASGRFDDAIALIKEGLTYKDGGHYQQAELLRELASCYWQKADPPEAEKVAGQALAFYEENASSAQPGTFVFSEMSGLYHLLHESYKGHKDWARAFDALACEEKYAPRGYHYTPATQSRLCLEHTMLCLEHGDNAGAEKYLLQTIAAAKEFGWPADMNADKETTEIAAIWMRLGKTERAIEVIEPLRKKLEGRPAGDPAILRTVYTLTGDIYGGMHPAKIGQALAYYKQALDMLPAAADPNESVPIVVRYAVWLCRDGQLDAARQALDRGRAAARDPRLAQLWREQWDIAVKELDAATAAQKRTDARKAGAS